MACSTYSFEPGSQAQYFDLNVGWLDCEILKSNKNNLQIILDNKKKRWLNHEDCEGILRKKVIKKSYVSFFLAQKSLF